jgi:hypothetical protein
MRGKSKPPKRLIDAVAMESANRAITEQTLNRLKEIATGQAGKAPAEEKSASSPKGKKTTTKKTAGSKPAAKTPVTKKVSIPPSPKGKKKA